MDMRFNIIATTPRGLEHEGASELYALLRELGDEAPKIERSQVAGLLLCETSLSPFDVTRRASELARGQPESIRVLQRLIPVERVVRSEVEDISRAAQELAVKIGEAESYRITVEKRFTSLSSREIIERVAAGIERKVNLEAPDWVVLIEVIGGITAISVLRPAQILNFRRLAAPPPEG
jgi:tRNA acetyltransferase TAN1